MSDPFQIQWREPWSAIEQDDAVAAEKELQWEICPGHVLFGRFVKAIGARNDCDDVLFYLGDSPPRFAVVHLTFSRETRPEWPHAELFESLSEWVEKRMIPDAEERGF